jgi:hypothetical protein
VVIEASSAIAALPTHFGTLGTGAGQISEEPHGIAVEQQSGDVYIADRNNARIDKFGPEGEFLLAWGWGVGDGSTEALQTCTTSCSAGLSGSGAGQFASPEGIAVDDSADSSHGDVYVVDNGNNRIEKFGPNGEFLLAFGWGVATGAAAAETCGPQAAPITTTCQAGLAGAGAGQFQSLQGRTVAVNQAGVVYVADEDRVQRFSPAGVVEGENPLAGVGAITNFALDGSGNFYLRGSAVTGIRRFEPNATELGPPRDAGGAPSVITIGPADELFVNDGPNRAEEGPHRILTFDSAGAQTSSFDGGFEGSEDRGIAYSEATDALYVLNAGTVRIVIPPEPGPYVPPGSESATEIGTTGVTLGATVNPEGGERTEYSFEYGPTASYGSSTPFTPLPVGEPFADQAITAVLANLQTRTAYHYRVIVTNEAGQTSEGPDQTFETLPPVSIDAASATEVTATSATLEVELNPHGLFSEYHFEYGTSTAYGAVVPAPDGIAGSGLVDISLSASIQGLQPLTTYHYRVVAHNALGIVDGADRSFTTQGPPISLLPDGRIWEMVSPPNKHGSPLEPITEEGGLIQTSTDGNGFAYVALGPINEEPKGVRSPHDSQLLATRGTAGWSTQDIATPHEEVSIIHAGFPSEYKFFSEDLGSSIVEPQGVTPLSPQAKERTPYRREGDGSYLPLITAANVPPGTKFGGEEIPKGTGQFGKGIEYLTSTPDGAHSIITSPQVLTAAGFSPGFESEVPNLYELSEGQLTLVSVLPNGESAAETGKAPGIGRNNLDMRGAISDNGQRVTFEFNLSEHLYQRDSAIGQTVQLDQLQPGAAGGQGKAAYQAANADGSKVFFKDAARLTIDSTAQSNKPDLYMCAITVVSGHLTCSLRDLSVDPNRGEAADVKGEVAAVDASGEHVYFAANGVLTNTPSVRGERAVPSECASEVESTCNLYDYDTVTEQITLVAVLSSADDPDWAGRTNLHVLGNLTARSSPNGRYFAFMSQRSLTGYDNRDATSGKPDAEVYLFDSASGALRCVSCNPTGARPTGIFDEETFPGLLVDHPSSWRGRWLAGSVPGWTLQSLNVALYQSRFLSDSGRLFFNAADALVPQDTNGVEDVYQYEPPGVGDCTTSSQTFGQRADGCVSLISSGTSPEESAFLDASESGDDVFFITASRLVQTDIDSALDVYDASIGGRSYESVKPVECSGDACQQPASAPAHPTPGTLLVNGPGNFKQKKCAKGKVRKAGKCVKKKAKAKGHKKKHKGKSQKKRSQDTGHKKRAKVDHGGGR